VVRDLVWRKVSVLSKRKFVSPGGALLITEASASGCTATASTTVFVNPLPIVSICPSITTVKK
jgi:hypothetical protein